MRRSGFLVAAVAMLVLGAIASASSARGASAFMSCGSPPTDGSGVAAGFDYRQHPSRCLYSEDGSAVKLIILVGIRWTGWGGPQARASAWRVDTHDQDNNGFQRHPVEIVVSGLRPVMSDQGRRKLYYTRLRVHISEDEVYVMRLHWPKPPPPLRKVPFYGREARVAVARFLSRRYGGSWDYRNGGRVTCNRRIAFNARKCKVAFQVGDGFWFGIVNIAALQRGSFENRQVRIRFRINRLNEYCADISPRADCVHTERGGTHFQF